MKGFDIYIYENNVVETIEEHAGFMWKQRFMLAMLSFALISEADYGKY